MKRAIIIVIGTALLLALVGSAVAGMMLGRGVLHPAIRPLTPELIQSSDRAFREAGGVRGDLLVSAPDGVVLRGWDVAPLHPNGDWVILFHGVSDNRAGMTGQAALLLRHGYGVIMMDSRAHGESGGNMATYGWLEREDTKSILDLVDRKEMPRNIFALGSSMGAAIALQSAAVDPRIRAVVAESSFSNLREVTFDYAGLHWSPWLGKTLFRPGTWTVISTARKEGGFSPDDVAPEKSVAARAFPVLLICDQEDHIIPCRHTRQIYEAAIGPKEFWEVPHSDHASAIGTQPAQYEQRVIDFLQKCSGDTAPARK